MFFYYVQHKDNKEWIKSNLKTEKKGENMNEKEVQTVEETKEVETTENTETQTVEEKVESKTFTQEEFKDALEKEIKRKTKNLPTKDELKSFKEWKESQKTEAEKQQEIIKENETLKAKLLETENKSVIASAGVDSKFQKFVLSEVSQMEGEFEDNLKDYLKDNPQFLQEKGTVDNVFKNTGVAVKKPNDNAESGVSAILKSKHPGLF